MMVEIQLEEPEAIALQKKAKALGKELSDYVGDVLRREAHRPLRSLQQIATDVDNRRGGPIDMSEDEIGEMLEKAKHEMRAERSQRSGQ